MTERFHSLTVVLSSDIREDDAEHLIAAIGMLKGVLSVAGNVADPSTYMAEQRARREMADKLWKALAPSSPT